MGHWRKAVAAAMTAAAAATAAKPPHTHPTMTLEEEGEDREKQLREGQAKSNVRTLPRRENAGGCGGWKLEGDEKARAKHRMWLDAWLILLNNHSARKILRKELLMQPIYTTLDRNMLVIYYG